MKRSSALVAALAAIVTLGAPATAAPGSITVFAAASLKEAFDAAAPAFTKATGVSVTFSYGGSDTLATQIRQGAPADVFASANEKQMAAVAAAGLLAAPARTFVRNRLVLIVPKANPAHITGLADLAHPGVKVVLAAPTVPVGSYARTSFTTVAGKPGYPADFAAAVAKNVVSEEIDVKAVATKIALGEGDVGIVYLTDVTPALAPQVTMIPYPPGASPDAVYPIAALKAAPNPSGAKAFVAFVLAPEGQRFLHDRGFAAP
ncbi:MAG TPA: molybdate ABC transporter substrate-binding protein [Candidatus Sulfotelmatobacter sp.]|nr:molybdate ABC transporter substrate-binding protein [Candidatus Sulfotelmatobacter sp.]